MIQSIRYSIDVIRDEVRQLVDRGQLHRHQPIYSLCQFVPPREWNCIELELEKSNFLLRDRVSDLLGHEEWEND